MSVYTITALGEQELFKHALKLPIRVRTLLIIIYTHRIPQLDIEALERVASPENFQMLEDLGLITAPVVAVSQTSAVATSCE